MRWQYGQRLQIKACSGEGASNRCRKAGLVTVRSCPNTARKSVSSRCEDSISNRYKERHIRLGKDSLSDCPACQAIPMHARKVLPIGCEEKALPTATVKAYLMAPSRAHLIAAGIAWPITVRTAYPIAARKRHAGLCKDSITHCAVSETILVHAKKVWPVATEKAWLQRRRTGLLQAGSI